VVRSCRRRAGDLFRVPLAQFADICCALVNGISLPTFALAS
jgi:hypothetical protein